MREGKHVLTVTIEHSQDEEKLKAIELRDSLLYNRRHNTKQESTSTPKRNAVKRCIYRHHKHKKGEARN